MCLLCSYIHTWLDILVFSGKDEKTPATSHSTITDMNLAECERTHTSVPKELDT